MKIDNIRLDMPDPTAAQTYYESAFGLGDIVRVGVSDAPTDGFRGFVVSLVVGQPGTVDGLADTALTAGFSWVKPAEKSFWGYGSVLRSPDGALWKLASSAKKDTGPQTRAVDDVVLLLGVDNVKATKQFYLEHGLTVRRSFGSKYVEFASDGSRVKLALYGRKAAAKDAGVPPAGSGSHRLVIGSDTGSFTDPDGFVWAVD